MYRVGVQKKNGNLALVPALLTAYPMCIHTYTCVCIIHQSEEVLTCEMYAFWFPWLQNSGDVKSCFNVQCNSWYLILSFLLHTVPPTKALGSICLRLVFSQLRLVVPTNSALQGKNNVTKRESNYLHTVSQSSQAYTIIMAMLYWLNTDFISQLWRTPLLRVGGGLGTRLPYSVRIRLDVH